MTTSTGPLADTQQRLRAVRPEYPHVYAVQVGLPDAAGWTAVDELIDTGIPEWYDATLRRDTCAGLRSVAAVRVLGSLAHVVLGRLTAALVLDGRAHDVSAANLAVHRAEDGHIDRVAVRRPTVTVLPGDPAAGEPGARVAAGRAELLDECGRQAMTVLGPAVAQVRALSRFGEVPAWNVIADSVLGTASFVPLWTGGDERAGRELGNALLDALVAHGARIRTRGVAEEVEGLLLPVRGSCCFQYRTGPEIEQPGDEYCTTCPLLDSAIRTRRLGNLLTEHIAPRRAAG